MAFFRTVSLSDLTPAIAGEGVVLRPPQISDYAEWARLRQESREFLKPWEPTWPADDLTRAGLAARVLPPQHTDDGYRVVLGPYATREQAEAIGRRLGRPFWIYQPGQ